MTVLSDSPPAGDARRRQPTNGCFVAAKPSEAQDARTAASGEGHLAGLGVRRAKAALFLWVKAPPGEMLPPEATGAVMEVTKWLKPSVAGHELRWPARVCRP